MPEITLNPPGLLAATLTAFMLGYVWYGLLFAKAWAKAVGRSVETPASELLPALALNLFGAALLVFVLANQMAVWLPGTWGLQRPGPGFVEQVASATGFTFVGFVLPVLLHRYAWEGRNGRLLLINGGYYLLMLLTAAALLRLV